MKQQRLMVWVGPTSSAKSTAALGMAFRFTNMGKTVILVRPPNSVRDHEAPGSFKTKDGVAWKDDLTFEVEHPWQILILEVKDPIHGQTKKEDIVWWIDEPGLFMIEQTRPDLYKTICELRKTSMVMVSGIASTSELEPFGYSIPLILATADEIIQCKGDCPWCGHINNATRSMYIGEFPKEGQAKVGGAESYQPACSDCWNKQIELLPNERVKAMLSAKFDLTPIEERPIPG